MTTTQTEARYYVHDRGAGQAAHLHHFSSFDCRYWIVDSTTNLPVDEFTTKRAAQSTASLMNRQDRIHDRTTCAICRADVADLGVCTPADHPKAEF